ncbi:MAG: Gfo/Idh/MocA family oxidoreductase [Planctomycetes bacterium]|nr:Gfo/Idh/MocA family oxidoreductase [Planctomycetota bacterium]
MGFIGVGKIANDYHLETLLGFEDVQAVAVCDVDTTRRLHAKQLIEEAYATERRDYKGIADYNDFRDLVARRDIDAVVIATPEHWHAIPLIEACKAGKHVYCEKPLTLTIAEARLCIEAARKHNRVVQTGSQQRSNVFGQFRQACELVRSGRLGKIRRLTVGVGEPSKWCDLPAEQPEPGLDWDLWLGYAPERPYNSILSPRGVHKHFPGWRSYREYGGGGMTDMGAHHFDIAQWALDMDRSGPVKIVPPDDPKAESGVKFFYASGIEMEHVRKRSGCVFFGEKGTLHIDRDKLESDPPEIVSEPLGADEVHLYESPGHHRDWIDCIRSGKRPVCDVEVGARSATVCHLGNLAYWYRRTLRWDPHKWEFVNDPEANTRRDRPRRDPWQLPKV